MITSPEVERYLSEVNPPADPLILEMERSGRERGFPIIGPQVGQLCEILARSIGAKRIYEMGSGFGYSTWWFSRVVGPDGQVVHSDGSQALSDEARDWLTRAELANRVRFEVGDARQLIAAEQGPFDLIFCDIDKEGYPEALELARPRLRSGGLLIVDNTIWSGRVAQPNPDATTAAILEFNRQAAAAPDLLTTILPLRDGVSVSYKL
ncbi:MAG: methyltransferase [Rickettsiales bacterium]|nr:methyltransferase [Rickettsiales bacterium]|tara:strand:+ start:787 stop:1410 length:624 start_codon:yes stop_codon:yes gene_type:complete